MKFFVYVLQSRIKKYIYVGLTNSLTRRVGQHQDGKGRTTAAYRPFDLIHVEEFEERSQARKRERYLKSGVGKEWIKTHGSVSARLPAGRQV